MSHILPVIRPEKPAEKLLVDQLTRSIFGPGAATRAAAALREGVPHCPYLAFVAELDGALIATIRFTPVRWGSDEVLMLGPLGVSKAFVKKGVGRSLMQAGMEVAQRAARSDGHDVVILVGDLPYYQPFGFNRIPPERISLPRPVDPARVLGCALSTGALDRFSGAVEPVLRTQ